MTKWICMACPDCGKDNWGHSIVVQCWNCGEVVGELEPGQQYPIDGDDMSRTNEPRVSLDEAERRIRAAWPEDRKCLPASWVAAMIWPKNTFLTDQGAGAAASRVLRQLEGRGVVMRDGRMRFWRLVVRPERFIV